MKTDYTYQTKLSDQLLKSIESGEFTATLLAANPGAGKTTMSQIVINNFIKKNPNAKVIVSTEGQNVLKNQYIDELDNSHIDISFEYGEYGSGKQVEVGIPQSRHRIKAKSIDLLVVDECHHYFLATMVQEIVENYNIKNILLMTGSPSKFIALNKAFSNTAKRVVKIHSISAEELTSRGIYSKVELDLVVDNKINKYNESEYAPIITAMSRAVEKNYDMSKIMVVCKRIKQAKLVGKILKEVYGRKVRISTCEDDKDNTAVSEFKNGDFNTLIVINRGVLGFNDPMLTSVIDLKDTNDIDTINQLISRLLRKHPYKTICKNYLKVVTKRNLDKALIGLNVVVKLLEKDAFEKFDGSVSSLLG